MFIGIHNFECYLNREISPLTDNRRMAYKYLDPWVETLPFRTLEVLLGLEHDLVRPPGNKVRLLFLGFL